jgi:hypothetical protein
MEIQIQVPRCDGREAEYVQDQGEHEQEDFETRTGYQNREKDNPIKEVPHCIFGNGKFKTVNVMNACP